MPVRITAGCTTDWTNIQRYYYRFSRRAFAAAIIGLRFIIAFSITTLENYHV
jgi:hypothetical protein